MYNDANITFQDIDNQPTYWLTRFVILRLLGIIYAIAFLVAINQIIPLIGSDGLTPIGLYIERVSNALGSHVAGFIRLPSLFWFMHSDTALIIVAWFGFLLSMVLVAGYANALLLILLWIFYMSFVHLGQVWYGYGWEILLLETGFLAIFLCPLFEMRPFPKREPPLAIIIMFRWLICRIMLGAGLIKLRGDEIWRNGTALYYHFETQPLPGPLSRWFHFLPRIILKAGVWFNWLAELLSPLFVFGPRYVRPFAGVIIISFQITLIFSGNLSFLNWLTIVPALACFDDSIWSRILPTQLVQRAREAANRAEPSRPMFITVWVVTVIVTILSFQPLVNMLSSRQIMNTSFDPLNLVNTYGAFGTVGRDRLNVVIEGTMDENPDTTVNWKPYIYKGLPVKLDEFPPQVAPYHLRLDWQMWFAAMSSPNQYPWSLNLVWKLLHNDSHTLGLFAENPFPGKPPRYIRILLYRYRFANPDNPKGNCWDRVLISMWLQPLSADDPDLIRFLESKHWILKRHTIQTDFTSHTHFSVVN